MPGITQFMAELAELGVATERRAGLVLVKLDIAPAGTEVPFQVATDPPDTYSLNPPHWLHLPAVFELPGGQGQPSELGGEWRKWSRKHPKWKGKVGAREWLAHARSLVIQAATP